MAVNGIGITISYSGYPTSGGSISDLRDVTPPSDGKYNDVDITTHSAAATDKRKRNQSGLIDPGSWSFKTLYDETQYAALIAIKGQTIAWTITFSDGSSIQVNAYINEDKIDSPMDGVIEVEYTLTIAD